MSLLICTLGGVWMLLAIPVIRKYGNGKQPLREAVSVLLGIAFGFVVIQGQSILSAITAEIFFTLLVAVALTDYDTMEIQDGFHIALLAVAILSIWTMPVGASVGARLLGFFCISVPMLVISLLVEGAFGGGDIKLMAVCGVLLGWKLTVLAAFLGIIAGGVWGMVLLAGKKAEKKDHFAFGPFLCAGMTIALLWGEPLLNMYFRLFGL